MIRLLERDASCSDLTGLDVNPVRRAESTFGVGQHEIVGTGGEGVAHNGRRADATSVDLARIPI